MKNRPTNIVFLCLSLLAGLSLIALAGCSQPAPSTTAPAPKAPAPAQSTPAPTAAKPTAAPPAQVITLKGVTYKTIQDPMMLNFQWLKEKLAAKSNGALVLNIIGGPESIAQLDQLEAMRAGTVDIVNISPSNFEGVVGSTGPTMQKLFRGNGAAQRKAGLFDWWNQTYKKANVMQLANTGHPGSRVLATIKPVKTLADIKGLKVRISGSAESDFVKALAGVPVTTAWAECYEALQKGVIDGYYGVPSTSFDSKYYEVAKYWNGPPVAVTLAVAIWMNAERFSKLPADLQKILLDVSAEVEAQNETYQKALFDDMTKKCKAGGVQELAFSADEEKKYLAMYDDNAWAIIKKAMPDQVEALKKLVAAQ